MILRAAALMLALLMGCGAGVLEPRAALPPGEDEPTGLLSRGAVEALQNGLRDRGYRVGHRGSLDEPTRQALVAFQRDHGLTATGMPSLATLQALGLDATDFYSLEEAGQRPWWIPEQ